MRHTLNTMLAASMSLLLAACSGGDTTTTLDANPELDFSVPDSIEEANFFDFSGGSTPLPLVSPVVSLASGDIVTMVQTAPKRWSGFINLRTETVYTVTITWTERFNNQNLRLTSRTFDLEVGGDGSAVEGRGTEYTESQFDDDGDGRSNFDERRSGTNPFDRNDPEAPESGLIVTVPGDNVDNANNLIAGVDVSTDSAFEAPASDGEAPADNPTDISDLVEDVLEKPIPATDTAPIMPEPADVIVPRISQTDAPVIDGLGVTLGAEGQFTGEWAQAAQSDISGATLSIDNLMIDINAEATGDIPYRRWAAMHDGTYLYIVVTVDDNGKRYRDSGNNLINDDSLELFLDADNSKSSLYGDDDFHRIFPLREAGNGASKRGVSGGNVAGPNSSSRTLDIEFSTGPGVGPDGLRRRNYEQDVYELRILLASTGISSDAPFGFELQVNDDDDGLQRDSKWGWKHPERVGIDIDNTVSDPSLMGTLMLE